MYYRPINIYGEPLGNWKRISKKEFQSNSILQVHLKSKLIEIKQEGPSSYLQIQQRKLAWNLFQIKNARGQLRQISYQIQPIRINIELYEAIKLLLNIEIYYSEEIKNLK